MAEWFVAHREGMRQKNERLVERRGFGIIGAELYQNVMDTDATECEFKITPVEGRPEIMLVVADNGPGFRNLSDAWTMFAPSEKQNDPTKAGRFNLGEKMVLSFAKEATIQTTSGTVVFGDNGREDFPRRKLERGTIFSARMNCTRERLEQLITYMRKILVRPGLKLTVNGEEIPRREPIRRFECALATEIGEDLRATVRKTVVEVYEPRIGESAWLHELGIPVVETDDRWSYSIQQKVPLNVDRDNVTPAYLKAVRVAVLNEMADRITEEDTTAPWVNEAASDKNCTAEAVETFRVKKYGEKSVAFDPTNPEANAEAVSHGYTLIPARGLTGGQRTNLYNAGTLKSSSQAFPMAGRNAYSNDPNAPPVEIVPEANLTKGMKLIREFTMGLGERLMDAHITVRFVNSHNGFSACFGRGHNIDTANFDYNLLDLGSEWFAEGVNARVLDLIIHEFGHYYERNHLSEKYYNALTDLGARATILGLHDPEWFKRFVMSL
jgi:hypothetical protein